jgi:hypothetical protein
MAVLNATQQPLETCMHERRPGTTVCLHCRHQARIVARERRKRLMLRGTAVLVVVAVVAAAGTLGTGALRNRSAAKSSDRARAKAMITVAQSADTQIVASQSASLASTAQTPTQSSAGSVAPGRVTMQGEVSRAHGARLSPLVALGKSSLGDGVTAERNDSGVVLVAFDTPEARTRIPEKFERFVRTTLPQLYGPAADSALAKVPDGGIASSQKALLYDLPTRGIRIALPNSWWLVLYPEIRPGQDGPLVVRYRSSVVDHVD